jgi:YVTN family beta-propeller protein
MSNDGSAIKVLILAAGLLAAVTAWADDGHIDNTGQAPLPSGQYVTPTAAPGSVFTTLNPGLAEYPNFIANGAIKTAVSPDGTTLLVMTSGYNLLTNASGVTDQTSQYVFVYNIGGANERAPVLAQVIQVPDTYVGLVWAPDTSKFYVSGGSTDSVFVYSGSTAGGWTRSADISMGHADFVSTSSPFYGLILNGIGFEEESTVAGLGLSSDGLVLAVANIYNDSISVIDTPTGTVRFEYDLRPYNTSAQTGVAGGETPFTVAVAGTVAGNNTVAYVSSIRDREVDVINITGATPSLVTRIALPGNPNSLMLSADQSTLYVTQDNSDSVAVINTATNKVIEEISTIAPPGLVPSGTKYTGTAANNLALSPDGRTLYVTNGGANSVAIIPLAGPAPHSVLGLVPTAWYPHSVSLSGDGTMLYVANGKIDPGSNPGYDFVAGSNDYVLQLEGGGLLTAPVPTVSALATLTAQVAANDGYTVAPNPTDAAVMAALHQNIKHIIYIIKENRTFDQMLGDLTNGSNADAGLVMYGKRVTPNFHALAQNFVTLDNFFCSGEVSGDGWAWSTEGRESDHGTKSIPPNYAGRGASNDSEGTNRDVDVGYAGYLARDAVFGGHGLYEAVAGTLKGGYQNLLPGTNNDFATDGPSGSPAQAGYLWDAAARAGLSVRNYGFFIDLTLYNLPTADGGLVPSAYPQYNYLESPYAIGLKVAASTNPTLQPYTDPYYWGFDNSYPDAWRVLEWQREFAGYVTGGNLPNLTLLRLMHDHTGNFGGSDPAVAGLTTPLLQQADNDLAVGEVVQTVANSPYAGSTLIFVLEDDAQDGPDHMDAHRSTAYVVGPYVKQHAVVSTRYSTVNMVRTIEDILGLDHLNLNDAYQAPMTGVFNVTQGPAWTYTATSSAYLKPTLVDDTVRKFDPALKFADSLPIKQPHGAAWWAKATRGFDWSDADKIAAETGDATAYNKVEWQGVKPGVPYPTRRSGADLRGHPVAIAKRRGAKAALKVATTAADHAGHKDVPMASPAVRMAAPASARIGAPDAARIAVPSADAAAGDDGV